MRGFFLTSLGISHAPGPIPNENDIMYRQSANIGTTALLLPPSPPLAVAAGGVLTTRPSGRHQPADGEFKRSF